MNTENWKWFRYDEIFEIRKGFFNKKPEESDLGTIPFIGATDSNNGVTSWYTIDEIDSTPKAENTENVPLNEKIFDSPCITVSNNGSVGFAFYQTQPFTCSHDVNPLYLKDKKIKLTPELAFFLCGVIECEKFRWTYGRKWRPERMPNSLIKLPIKEKGQPDWQWMEEYVKNTLLPKLPEKARQVWEKKYNNKPLSAQKLELKTDEWEWFDYYGENGLFQITGSTTTPKDILEESGSGKHPYVTTQAVNNGIEGYFNIATEKGNVFTVDSAVLGFCAYQEKDFSASDHVEKLIPKFRCSKYIAMFFTTIINREQYRYNYGRKASQTKLRLSKIKLPAIQNAQGEYEPDWQWMEDYIKGLPYSRCL